MNTPAWLVRLYPRGWRERYGEEFQALLEESLGSPLDVLDVALGALDAHLGYLHDMNWRLLNMLNKLRTTILIVFAAYIAFIIAGFSLVGLVDDSPALALMRTDRGLLAVWTTIQAAAVIALLAVVIGGLPLAWLLIRRAFTSSQRTLGWLLTPIMALLILGLYGVFMYASAAGWIHLPGVAQVVSPGNFPIGNKLLLGGFMLVFILGAVASTLAVWKAVTGLDQEADGQPGPGRMNLPGLYRFSFNMAMVVTLAMAVMLIATGLFGWMAHSALPDWFTSNLGLLMTNTAFSYGVTLTIMVLATAAAVFALVRGFGAKRTGEIS